MYRATVNKQQISHVTKKLAKDARRQSTENETQINKHMKMINLIRKQRCFLKGDLFFIYLIGKVLKD